MDRSGNKIIFRCLIFIAFFLAWEFGASITNPVIIPKPREVLISFVGMLKNGALIESAMYSFLRITIASMISGVCAILIGSAMKTSNIIRYGFDPFLKVMRFLPVTAFYPMLMIWFGIGEQMKISFLFVATFVYMLPSVLLSMDSVDKDVIEVASVEGASRFAIVKNIILPIAAPDIAQSFVMMYGIGYTYIAVAEQVNAKNGLGYLIYTSSARGLTYVTFVGIAAIIIISIGFDMAANKFVKRVFNWKFF